MINVGQMNFFKVNQCGLYKLGVDDPCGCDLHETFDLLFNWAQDRPMSATLPWDAKYLSSKPKCYLRDIHKDPSTGDYLLVLWKSDTDDTGSLWGAAEDSTLGTGEVVQFSTQHKGKKVIWGRPCYYWVLPNFSSIISIKFDHSVCDSQLFQSFITACITNRVPHPTRVKETTPHGYVRISHSEGDDLYKYSYRFDVNLRSLNTSSVELNNFARSVTHIVSRETIEVDVKDQRADWVKMFNELLPSVSAKPKSKFRQIEIKAEAKPTAKEIKDIIEKHAEEHRKSSDWDNVGFYGENGMTWVDRYRLKDEVVITENKKGLYTAKFLLDELHKSRSQYIKPISKSLEEIKLIVPKAKLKKNDAKAA